MNLRPSPSHLTDELSEYAAGRLPDVRALHWDRHLVACECCRAAVAVERRMQSVLTTGPSMPPSLRTTLLAMGSALPAPAPFSAGVGAGSSAHSVPAVPQAPAGLALPSSYSLPVVRPTAPALHRSPLRSAVMATVVAGASAAAAWGLGVTAGATGVATTGVVRPLPASSAASRAGGSSTNGTPIGSSTTAVPAAYRWPTQLTGLRTAAPGGAQSTP